MYWTKPDDGVAPPPTYPTTTARSPRLPMRSATSRTRTERLGSTTLATISTRRWTRWPAASSRETTAGSTSMRLWASRPCVGHADGHGQRSDWRGKPGDRPHRRHGRRQRLVDARHDQLHRL